MWARCSGQLVRVKCRATSRQATSVSAATAQPTSKRPRVRATADALNATRDTTLPAIGNQLGRLMTQSGVSAITNRVAHPTAATDRRHTEKLAPRFVRTPDDPLERGKRWAPLGSVEELQLQTWVMCSPGL
jgi:hypothetical protein